MKNATNQTWTKKDWVPVRRGDAYCSPACGGGEKVCSMEHYERAVDAANELARDLGDGWEPEIWENLGWHARVNSSCGRISVHIPLLPRDVSYMAFLGPRRLKPAGKWAEHGRTAREAIANVIDAARRDLGVIESCVRGLKAPAVRRGRAGAVVVRKEIA